MVNNIPVYCRTYLDRDEDCPILKAFPAIYPEGQEGPGINEYPVELCLKCGHSMIEADGPTCLNCHEGLSRQGSGHVGATPEGSWHVFNYKCERCGLRYYSHHELF